MLCCIVYTILAFVQGEWVHLWEHIKLKHVEENVAEILFTAVSNTLAKIPSQLKNAIAECSLESDHCFGSCQITAEMLAVRDQRFRVFASFQLALHAIRHPKETGLLEKHPPESASGQTAQPFGMKPIQRHLAPYFAAQASFE